MEPLRTQCHRETPSKRHGQVCKILPPGKLRNGERRHRWMRLQVVLDLVASSDRHPSH